MVRAYAAQEVVQALSASIREALTYNQHRKWLGEVLDPHQSESFDFASHPARLEAFPR
jgi:hypothetical protein